MATKEKQQEVYETLPFTEFRLAVSNVKRIEVKEGIARMPGKLPMTIISIITGKGRSGDQTLSIVCFPLSEGYSPIKAFRMAEIDVAPQHFEEPGDNKGNK